MRCLLTSRDPYKTAVSSLELPQLESAQVQVSVHYSSVNYKDALAVTGKGKILKSFPLIPGIDAAGVVIRSSSKNFKEGDQVLVTGCGLGESHHGGFAEQIQAPEDWVIPLPEGLSLREAMIFGTAGFTAGLCLWRMEQMGQKASQGPILISGASGGVGSLATAILFKAGYEVHCSTSKTEHQNRLLELGASKIVSPDELLSQPSRPLESSLYAGAIDNLGGQMLHALLSRTQLWGNVCSVGLALSADLNTTVMPMILRGVSLLGISSANTPRPLRETIWRQLSSDWKPQALDKMIHKELALNEIEGFCHDMISQKTFGRTLVNLKGL